MSLEDTRRSTSSTAWMMVWELREEAGHLRNMELQVGQDELRRGFGIERLG